MNITLTLTQEEADALAERVDLYNAGSGQPAITVEQYMGQIQCREFVERLATERYQKSLTRLGEMFKAKPYDARLATIDALEKQA